MTCLLLRFAVFPYTANQVSFLVFRMAPSPRRSSSPLALDRAALLRFLQHCIIESYAPRTAVFQPGDPGNLLLFIVKGRATIVAESPDGQELALNHVVEDEFVGEAGLFVPVAIRSVYLKTVTQCDVASIECNRLLELMQNELAADAAKIMHALGIQLARRLMETSRKASGLAFLDVSARIWRALEDLTHEPGAMTHPKGVQIKTSRQDLARTVGCSREMAGRVIKQLTDENKMEAHGKTMVIFRH